MLHVFGDAIQPKRETIQAAHNASKWLCTLVARVHDNKYHNAVASTVSEWLRVTAKKALNHATTYAASRAPKSQAAASSTPKPEHRPTRVISIQVLNAHIINGNAMFTRFVVTSPFYAFSYYHYDGTKRRFCPCARIGSLAHSVFVYLWPRHRRGEREVGIIFGRPLPGFEHSTNLSSRLGVSPSLSGHDGRATTVGR